MGKSVIKLVGALASVNKKPKKASWILQFPPVSVSEM